jgi:hypothetical protein
MLIDWQPAENGCLGKSTWLPAVRTQTQRVRLSDIRVSVTLLCSCQLLECFLPPLSFILLDNIRSYLAHFLLPLQVVSPKFPPKVANVIN